MEFCAEEDNAPESAHRHGETKLDLILAHGAPPDRSSVTAVGSIERIHTEHLVWGSSFLKGGLSKERLEREKRAPCAQVCLEL